MPKEPEDDAKDDDSINSKFIDQPEPAAITEDDDVLEADATRLSKAQTRSKDVPTDVYHTTKQETVEDILKAKGYNMDLANSIGSGGFGKVYKGTKASRKRRHEDSENTRTYKTSSADQNVACKVIELSKNKKRKLQELKHELYVLETVSHENIVKLFEHFIVDERVYIFMELAEGGNLADFVKARGPLNEKVSRRFFRQICEALLHMHKMKISHRDLKLANVLLDETKKVCKVTDFGLSRVVFTEAEGVLFCSSYCGTALYMAPEIVRIKKAKAASLPIIPYNPFKADIWALGICLYAMINKAWPFNDEKPDMLDIMLARKWRIVKKIRKSISSEVKLLLGNLLEPDADKRIDFYGISNHPWMTGNKTKTGDK